MVDIEYIRKKHYVERWSIRKIARNLGISRQSVRKALASAEMPRYRRTRPRPFPVMDPYRAIILAWLEADAAAPPKQRHTAKRIYDRLVEEYGFTGAESTVRRFVRLLKARIPEAYVPLTADWGEQAQVDWGQAVVKIGGVPTVMHLFCLRLRASGVCFAQAFPTEKLEAFLAGPHRQEHDYFAHLRAHYLFESHFCNPARAHEKGAAENLVGYVRRNALVPVQDFASWEELNAHLLDWCNRDRARRPGWPEEQAALHPLPDHPLTCAITRMAVVSRTGLVTFDRNRYSVPCRWVGQTVMVSATWDRVQVMVGEEVIAVHQRCYARGQTILELEHYLPVLAQKPRAAKNALAVRQLGGVWDRAREVLCRGRVDGYRELAEILLLHREYPHAALTAALEQALSLGTPTARVVRQLLLNASQNRPPRLPVNETLSAYAVAPPDLTRYDALAWEVSRCE
ncbi:IS21/IS408/IS1162 family transposase [Desulfothermobacter acidiphilus]|uniref:IS21/IS408/IS1162 family transposase n=1 Tax=Desulfothermobacter acidiphilus TaxID=1938353 RepID=UPI003F8C94F7